MHPHAHARVGSQHKFAQQNQPIQLSFGSNMRYEQNISKRLGLQRLQWSKLCQPSWFTNLVTCVLLHYVYHVFTFGIRLFCLKYDGTNSALLLRTFLPELDDLKNWNAEVLKMDRISQRQLVI